MNAALQANPKPPTPPLAAGKRRREQIAAGRRLSVQHLPSAEDTPQRTDHPSLVQRLEGHAKDLVEKRDAWLNPPGLGEKELKKRTFANEILPEVDIVD